MKLSRDCLPETTDFSFFGPDIRVQALREVIGHDRAVLVVYDRRESIIDQETCDTKSEQQSNKRNNGDPFLLGILLCQPWLLYLSLVYSSRMEISGWESSDSGGGAERRCWSRSVRRLKWVCSRRRGDIVAEWISPAFWGSGTHWCCRSNHSLEFSNVTYCS